MIDGLHPRAEQPVELGQVLRRACLHLDEELDTHRLKNSFDLSPALGFTWSAVDKDDAEARARPKQLLGDVRGTVIDIASARHAA